MAIILDKTMVAPVTGPFTTTVDTIRTKPGIAYNYRTRRRVRTWYRQKRPYDRPLTFSFSDRDASGCWDNRTDYSIQTYDATPPFDEASRSRAYNKAYESLRGKVGDRSQWAVNLLEGEKSVGMIVDRATKLRKAFVAVRKFRFKDAARILGLAETPRVSKKKSVASNWLEYHFGWTPLVMDIGAGLDIICNPISDEWKLVVGKGVDSYAYFSKSATDLTYGPTRTWVRAQVEVRVANPNLLLLQQLGFVNPLSVVWELVPFSFLVDWFTNVGQVLDSYTDWMGLELRNHFAGHKQESTRTFTWYASSTIWQTPPIYKGQAYAGGTLRAVYVERRLGLSGPTIYVRPFKGLSVARGATAIALLLQQLKH